MWGTLNLFLVFVLISRLSSCRGKYTKINSKPDDVVFKYPEEASSERKLKECKKHDACNVVHERFWLPVLVERICRCPNGFECPWSVKTDDFSMMLNNRSLLKFCDSQKSKKNCTRKNTAAVVNGRIKTDHSAMTPHEVRINCTCPRTHYWKVHKYTFEDDNSLFQTFRCQKQTMCERFEFCGYVRADLFSVYYRCTCPEKHLCVPKDREREEAQELLYTGPAFKAYCQRWE